MTVGRNEGGAVQKAKGTEEPRYNEVLDKTNDIPQSGFLKCMEQNLDITNQLP